jgi:excisionase family DNA binding protein
MLNTREVAARLRVNHQTVQRWCQSGQLKAVRLPGRGGYRVSEAEVARFDQDRPDGRSVTRECTDDDDRRPRPPNQRPGPGLG